MTAAMRANVLEEDLDHVLEHTRDLWEELRGSRIFISGGTGFLGSWLLESLVWANTCLNLNTSAVVLTRNPEAFARKAPNLARHSAIVLQSGDVRSFDFPQGQFRFIIHAATDANVLAEQQSALGLLDTIVDGTRHMLEFARHCGAVAFLLTSSGAVYGKQPPGLTHIPEDFAGAPQPADARSTYAEGKRMAELLCCLYASQYGVESKIARCFAFAGPYLPLDASFAIGNFIRDGLAGVPIRVCGDRTAYRSYLYSADLAIWLWTILFRGVNCRPYNVGSEAELTVGALAEKVAAMVGGGGPPEIQRRPAAKAHPERYTPSTRRARTELGLCEWISLDTAILSMARWNRRQSVNCFLNGTFPDADLTS